ncbi:MAG: oligosaccharide flippase family protein [bacterium]
MFISIKNKIYRTLRWSEKYAKTDMVYLARGGIWMSLGQIISSAAAFLLSLAFANLLPKETYGFYKYIMSLASLLAISTLPGMATAVSRAAAIGQEGALIPAVKTKIKWGLLGSLSSLILALYYFLQANNALTISFLIVSIFLPLMDSFGLYSPYLSGKKMFGLNAKLGAAGQVLTIALMIIVIWLSKNLYLLILAYFASNTFFNFLTLKYILNKRKPNANIDAKTISYGKKLSFMNVLTSISGSLDKIMLWHYLGAASVAVYSLAQAPINQASSFFKTILSLAFPKMAAADDEDIKKTLPGKMAKFFVLMLACVIIYIIAAPFLFKILFPKYVEAVNYSRIFSLTLLFFPQKLIGTALEAKAQTKSLYFISISNSIVRIILLAVLLPLYGIYGAIWAIVLPYFWNTLTQMYFLKRL